MLFQIWSIFNIITIVYCFSFAYCNRIQDIKEKTLKQNSRKKLLFPFLFVPSIFGNVIPLYYWYNCQNGKFSSPSPSKIFKFTVTLLIWSHNCKKDYTLKSQDILVATTVGLEDFEKILRKGEGGVDGVLKSSGKINLKWGE